MKKSTLALTLFVPLLFLLPFLLAGCRNAADTGAGTEPGNPPPVPTSNGPGHEVVIDANADPDRPTVVITAGKDTVTWTAGEGVASFSVKFTHHPDKANPNTSPSLNCQRVPRCELPAAATLGKANGCRSGKDLPLRQCSYEYAIEVWHPDGSHAGVDPVIIVDQG
ncbi:MAG: hypothetical protein WBX15_05155 [Thermoanaerobaculia bacterium]